VVFETQGNPKFNQDKWYCKIHSTEAREKRDRRSKVKFDAKMAPERYMRAAAAACRKAGLTIEDLHEGLKVGIVVNHE